MIEVTTTHGVKRFSPSALNAYAECPRRWGWQYAQRVEAERLPTPQLVLGNAVHAALGALYRAPVEARDEAALHRLLRVAWSRTERGGVFLSTDEEADWGRRALSMLSAYCAGWDLSIRPLALEAWVRANLAGRLQLFGRADRVDVARGDERFIEVVDYKTGRAMVAEDLPTDIGAQLYALAATRSFGRPVGRVRFIYLADAQEVTWNVEPDDLALAEERLAAKVAAIRADHELSPQPGFHCRWCPYAPICDARDQTQLEPDDAVEEVVPF